MEEANKNQNIEALRQIDFELLAEDGLLRKCDLDRTFIFGYLHILPSIEALVRSIVQLGVPARNIVLQAKTYSSIPETETSLEMMGVRIVSERFEFLPGEYDTPAVRSIQATCDYVQKICAHALSSRRKVRLILVDDGGVLTEWWHKKFSEVVGLEVVSVQQTASGIGRQPSESKIPKINVAHSAAKKWFESKIIARAIVNKIRTLGLIRSNHRIGIVGYGPIGRSIFSYYNYGDRTIYLNDRKGVFDDVYETHFHSKSKIISRCDVVFGCTGRNWFSDRYLSVLDGTSKDQLFISCSSRDIEFKYLLQKRVKDRKRGSGFYDISLDGKGNKVILNCGFPVNFDRKKEWEEFQDIVLTRSLVLAGIVQAMCLPIGKVYRHPVMLSPAAQRHVVSIWLDENGYRDTVDKMFGVSPEAMSDIDWWRQESSGGLIASQQFA